jgi:hypothetical protein
MPHDVSGVLPVPGNLLVVRAVQCNLKIPGRICSYYIWLPVITCFHRDASRESNMKFQVPFIATKHGLQS